jgi:type IV secretory pathway VirJ component
MRAGERAVRHLTGALLAFVLCACATPARAAAPPPAGEPLRLSVRGKTLTLRVYRPSQPPKGTVIMASGDVGWVGTGVSMANYLSREGFIVVGVNVRQYLVKFRTKTSHLTVTDPPADYRQMSVVLERHGLLVEPVVLSGVSEGAALAVLAASAAENHEWVRGVITLGLPPTAELAWKWRDFTTWITKADAKEPSFAPKDFIGAVAPVPIVMIQSTKDEYVPETEYRALEAAAKPPKKLVLIDARNHRFGGKRTELRRDFLSALDWIQHPSQSEIGLSRGDPGV